MRVTAARAAREIIGKEPGDWFVPGSEMWQQLSHTAWMTGAAASRSLGGGFAAQIPYDELFAFRLQAASASISALELISAKSSVVHTYGSAR